MFYGGSSRMASKEGGNGEEESGVREGQREDGNELSWRDNKQDTHTIRTVKQ